MNDPSFYSEAGIYEDKNNSTVDKNDLSELRRILTGPLEDRVDDLQKRLDNEELRSEEISNILPEAIKIRSTVDDKVGKALESTITSSIRASINKDRKIFADVLFPILGPAIRKAIASVILGMLQSFNQVLEQSLSIKGLKWRFEAFRTKRPFAEIVLLKTLLFQVEQVFLIHSKTGLVLQHVAGKEIIAQDPDLVSSMLTAIQDFVYDSFSNEKDDSLDTLRMGLDRSVWIERGANAILAVVIRGTPPLNLRSEFRDIIEDINQQDDEALESFDGDTEPFEIIKPRLESCLQYKTTKDQTKFSAWLWFSLAVVFSLIAFFSFIFIQKHLVWSDFIENLKNEPGIVITNTEKTYGIYHIFGLRDPYASDVGSLLEKTGIDVDEVVFHLEPYNSFSPEFLLKRVNKILQPDQTTVLMIKENVLHLMGTATHQWIVDAEKLLPLIPGVDNYNSDELIDADHRSFKIISKRIEDNKIYFDFQMTKLTDDGVKRLDLLNELIDKLTQSAGRINKAILIEITGHTDSIGKEATNMRISEKRAERVVTYLAFKGQDNRFFLAKGVSSSVPQLEEVSDGDRALNRYVSFRVIEK